MSRSDDDDFSGRTAIVTGASKGLGKVLALELGRIGLTLSAWHGDVKNLIEWWTKSKTLVVSRWGFAVMSARSMKCRP